MFCVKCGAQVPDNAVFCNACGFDQRIVPQPQEQPAYQQPAYQQPVYEQPANQQPAYRQPAYQQPVYEQPANQQPVYEQPANQQPAYQQPAYQQPAYQQPAYQQPVYQQPVYQQPVHQPPVKPAAVAGTAVKAAKGGGSVIAWILAAVALVGVAVFLVVQFDLLNIFKSDEDLIRERIEALETAYNETDWEGIVECMDGPTRAALEITMGFADGLMSDAIGFDISMEDMFAMSGLMISGDYCQLEVTNIQIDGDYAYVTVVMSVDLYDVSETEEMVLPMVKEGNDWYITGMGDMDLFGFGY